ncbi:MAG: phosphotransferase [Shimia sp.]|uniref:phosphotransferase n=1 Tax=Shimia sp. TaxID=1954381 RepID=UPI004059B3D0
MWTPLFGGRTNAAWLGQTSAGDFVAKLYSGAALNPLFPNDPNAESMLLHALADTGHTPVFRAQLTTEAGICNLYDHIPGQTWQDGVSDVARLMRTLHMLPCPDGLRTAPDGAAALASQTLGILSKCDTPGELLSVQPASGPSSSGARCLLHSDIVPGNLIRNGNSLHLIDWQCPAVGDPCEDIAIFLSPAMQHLYRGKVLSRADEASFFEAYAVPDIQKRYQALAPFYHWRMAAYCLWQMQNGRSDYAEGLAMERAAFQRSESSKPT